MEIWAHRGRTSPRLLGNSKIDFLKIKRLGITGFEADICFTLDRKIIIYHPGSTTPDLSQMLSSDIDNSIFNVMYLDDLLNLMMLYPDLECCLDFKENSDNLVIHTVEAIAEEGLQKRIYLTAFQKRLPMLSIESDAKLLTLAKDICPEIKTHVIVIWPWNLTKLVFSYRYLPDAISIGWLQEPTAMRLMSKSLFKSIATARNLEKQIEKINKANVKTWAGVFNDPKDVFYFMDLGIKGIVTDDPSGIINGIGTSNLI